MEVLKDGAFPDGYLLNDFGERVPFHTGQWEAWESDTRFTFVYAGSQGGKTAFGPVWLHREIKRCGAGDYIAATSTYDLFKLKMLPALRRLFEQETKIGRYWPGLKVIELADPMTLRFYARTADDPMWGRIILRSAQSESGLESATAKAALLDECGMDEFGLDSWEAVQRRLSISRGRVLGTTTLYNRGWTKVQIYDRWRAGDGDYRVVSFPSYTNPAFPKEEYDRIVGTLPRWKVNMFYRGEFDVPEGLIYDTFDADLDVVSDYSLPAEWRRWGGLDFGGVHMAAVCYAEHPTEKDATGKPVLILEREYLQGGRTISEHAAHLKGWNVGTWFGGAKSEEQWRVEFRRAGLPVSEPRVPEVEVGIGRVYAVHKAHGIRAFRSCERYLDEKGTYGYELDAEGKATDKIKDKATFHIMDAERYVIASIRGADVKAKVVRLG